MNILLVGDDVSSRENVAKFLLQMGQQVVQCRDVQEDFDKYTEGDFSIVLFTGHGDMETVIEALRLGADEYLLKPINLSQLAVIIKGIAEKQSLLGENKVLTGNNAVRAATSQDLFQFKEK